MPTSRFAINPFGAYIGSNRPFPGPEGVHPSWQGCHSTSTRVLEGQRRTDVPSAVCLEFLESVRSQCGRGIRESVRSNRDLSARSPELRHSVAKKSCSDRPIYRPRNISPTFPSKPPMNQKRASPSLFVGPVETESSCHPHRLLALARPPFEPRSCCRSTRRAPDTRDDPCKPGRGTKLSENAIGARRGRTRDASQNLGTKSTRSPRSRAARKSPAQAGPGAGGARALVASKAHSL